MTNRCVGRKLFGAAVLSLVSALPLAAQANGWVGLGTGAPGWALYMPTPYLPSPAHIDYYRYRGQHGYPAGFFIGGNSGGHYLHQWW